MTVQEILDKSKKPERPILSKPWNKKREKISGFTKKKSSSITYIKNKQIILTNMNIRNGIMIVQDRREKFDGAGDSGQI